MAKAEGVSEFLDRLGCMEEPMAVLYTDIEPSGGFSPDPAELLTFEKERSGEMDWKAGFENWNCLMSKVWLARRKGSFAWFSAERIGCFGGAYYLGFNPRQPDAATQFVSTGIPGGPPGERYIESPQAARTFFDTLSPVPASGRYCVVKPLSILAEDEEAEVIVFFARPEIVSGLHFLQMFVTQDQEGVRAPWGSACSSMVTMVRKYQSKGELKAVIGGWDCTCRKYFKPDEIIFSMPLALFEKMLARWKESFLVTHTWDQCRKKIALSERVWSGAKNQAE